MCASQDYVAFFRGVNVGGKNRLPMDELRQVFAELGCKEVRTFIQSGNVLFRAPARGVAGIEGKVASEIEARFGFGAPVILRSKEALLGTLARNPFPAEAEDVLHIAFLAGTPASASALDPDRSPPDRFVLDGTEVFLCLPNGVARSKLTNAWFDARLKTVSTIRNWKTIQKIADLL